METIHIFHTNDVHSHFQYWQRMTNYINYQRRLLANKGETSFLVDVGDFLDRSNLYTEATLGKGNVKLLNEAEYDCVTIGNNEGITLSTEDLFHLYDEAKFDVVVSNIERHEGDNPPWLKPYTILTTMHGTKVGIIAATAPFEMFYKQLGWTVTDAHAALIQLAFELRPQVDILVCLSHLGISEDELLAEECPIIDIIFGAHTHHVLEEGKLVNGVLLTGGGKFGQYVGQLTIQYDSESKEIMKKEDQLIELALLSETEDEMDFLNTLHFHAMQQLSTPLFQLHKTYTKEWFHYSPLSDLFAKKLFEFTNADVAIFNAGIFMDDLKKGYITAADLHRILPHPINLCTLMVKGAELKEIYRQSQNEEWPNIQLKGLGFRGVVMGKILTYGMHNNKENELIIHNEVVDAKKEYKLVTLDMFTFGFFFPSFKSMKKDYLLPYFLRDLLRDVN